MCGALLAGVAVTAAASADQSRTIDRQIPVQSIREVRLTGRNGNIRVKGTDTAAIRVHAIVSVGDKDSLEDASVEVTRVGSTLEIQDRCPKKSYVFFSTSSCGVEYALEVPKTMRLNLKDANGNNTVTNVSGPITIKTSNGDVTVSDAGGTLDLESSRGNVDATLVGGWRGDQVSLRTSLGEVSLRLPAGFRGRLDAKTAVGEVVNGTKLNSSGTGTLLKLRSSLGNVNVSYR
jgi:DUF4097 and DUF4098 domain-containing protein YvlB